MRPKLTPVHYLRPGLPVAGETLRLRMRPVPRECASIRFLTDSVATPVYRPEYMTPHPTPLSIFLR